VLDEDNSFETRCNMAMVDLEPVTGDVGNELTRLTDDMTGHDAERLHKLLENHARYSNSQRARDILDNWNSYLPKFRKVMPTEFRRALNELAQETEQAQPAAGE
jgi:glutamate synthase (NADPH/NADH) large chain